MTRNKAIMDSSNITTKQSSKQSKKQSSKEDVVTKDKIIEQYYSESSEDDDFIPPDSEDDECEEQDSESDSDMNSSDSESDDDGFKNASNFVIPIQFTFDTGKNRESDESSSEEEEVDEIPSEKSKSKKRISKSKPKNTFEQYMEALSEPLSKEEFNSKGKRSDHEYEEYLTAFDEPISETISKKKVKRRKLRSKPKQKKTSNTTHSDETLARFQEMLEIASKSTDETSLEMIKTFETLVAEEKAKVAEKNKQLIRKTKKKNSREFKKMLREKSHSGVNKYFKTLDVTEQKSLMERLDDINKHINIIKPYKVTLIDSPVPVMYKASAMQKINALDYMEPGSNEYYKIKQWVDTFMKIPFNVYSSLPVNIDDGVGKCSEFMTNARDILNDAVYGMDDAKLQILQMVGQWISNPSAMGSAVAIKGPMGTGKTTLVKEGISKILNRPFEFIALGGATDSSFLEGHSYTYEGSIWGKIVDILIKSKCMNPIIYFDELDKVSDTPKGEEIIGILTHLTDTSQNSKFHDKYFSDIDFDLSKVLFIFSYNDDSKVNPILRDRMYRIQTDGYNAVDKKIISKDYLIPSIERNVNFNTGDIIISDEAIEYLVRDYTGDEKGVRNLKRCIEIIYTKLNMFRLMKPETKLFENVESFELKYPFNVTQEIVQKLVKQTTKRKYSSMYI